MVRTQIQLTEQQARALKDLAHAQGVPVAELIRQGVDYVLRSQAMTSMDERRRRALAAAGRFRSNVEDLAAAHDRYLAEAYGDDLR